jgi:hypothetical protein
MTYNKLECDTPYAEIAIYSPMTERLEKDLEESYRGFIHKLS